MPDSILKLAGVRKDYRGAAESKLEVLKGIDLELREGESLAIVGPSGSGKSTLLNVIGALDRPDGGTIWFDGKDISKLDEIQLARLRNESIGFVFQSHCLLPHCTVLENVLVPTIPLPRSELKAAAKQRALSLLQKVGLQDRANHRPGELSGGERQRAAVVRALINSPRLVLADEPTGALDHASAQNLGAILLALNKEEKATLIVVTHSAELAARMEKQREIRDGRLLP